MPYTKTEWKDKIKDSAGNIIQEGTPLSAGNLNKIESGIDEAHKQLEQAARETVSLPYGTSVINSPDGSLLDIEIQGRTLISMGNSPLEGGKKYVLADPKTAVVIDGTTYKGVSKFEGKNSRAGIIITADFEGKISGSELENPHLSKQGQFPMLQSPSNLSFESQWNYDQMKTLNGLFNNQISVINGNISQNLYSFNLIAEIERKVGKIPGVTTSAKVTWLKNNINRIACGWYGYGRSASGNKANLQVWSADLNKWSNNNPSATSSSVTSLNYGVAPSSVPSSIDSSGFIHFLAYAEPSDGIISSVINTDYVFLDIELKSNAGFYEPRVPLYEVSQEAYDKILVDWDATTVMNHYPMAEGIKPLRNPILAASELNLLPPFTEWRLHSNADNKISGSYELEITSKGPYQVADCYINCVPNRDYTFSAEMNYPAYYDFHWLDSNGNSTQIRLNQRETFTFTTPANARRIRVVANHGTEIGKFKFKNPMLILGSSPKPFRPQGTSYLYADIALHGLNSDPDLLYQDDGRWKVTKKWEEVILDSSHNWSWHADYPGHKAVKISDAFGPSSTSTNQSIYEVLTGFGKRLKKLTVSGDLDLNSESAWFGNITGTPNIADLLLTIPDALTGWADTYIPTTEEIKVYFNGWKVKAADASNKPTAWMSIIDGSDAPNQTLAYVLANKAPNYTGYRIIYQFVAPKLFDVTERVEGALSINGQTQISVESGIIIREKVASPTIVGSLAFINRKAGDSNDNPLTYRTLKILNIYKETTSDFYNWTIEKNFLGHGLERAVIPSNLVDPTANYYVTYLVLDKEKLTTNPINVLATYNTSLRSTVNDIAAKLADVSTLTSVQERYLYKLLLAAKANGWSV